MKPLVIGIALFVCLASVTAIENKTSGSQYSIGSYGSASSGTVLPRPNAFKHASFDDHVNNLSPRTHLQVVKTLINNGRFKTDGGWILPGSKPGLHSLIAGDTKARDGRSLASYQLLADIRTEQDLTKEFVEIVKAQGGATKGGLTQGSCDIVLSPDCDCYLHNDHDANRAINQDIHIGKRMSVNACYVMFLGNCEYKFLDDFDPGFLIEDRNGLDYICASDPALIAKVIGDDRKYVRRVTQAFE